MKGNDNVEKSNASGRDVARGELMRFLMEAAWYPTALLPSQGVIWKAVDSRSARATLTDAGLTLTLLFHFQEDGLIETVMADARGRLVGDQIMSAPWLGRFWNYTLRDGMRVPLDGEVAWLLPKGAKPYWRGRIADAAYEFAKQPSIVTTFPAIPRRRCVGSQPARSWTSRLNGSSAWK